MNRTRRTISLKKVAKQKRWRKINRKWRRKNRHRKTTRKNHKKKGKQKVTIENEKPPGPTKRKNQNETLQPSNYLSSFLSFSWTCLFMIRFEQKPRTMRDEFSGRTLVEPLRASTTWEKTKRRLRHTPTHLLPISIHFQVVIVNATAPLWPSWFSAEAFLTPVEGQRSPNPKYLLSQNYDMPFFPASFEGASSGNNY